MNRHQRRKWVADAKKMAHVVGDELFIEMEGKPFKIADLNKRHASHGVSIKQLLTEWIAVQDEDQSS